MMTGLKTFSSKFPCEPANQIAVSLPITCTATMVIASHCVGFTLPGMIEDPGSFSGSVSSPNPQRGPEASHRISFAIFISEAASVFSAPLANTISSCAESAVNLFGCDRNGSPVNSPIFRAARSANSASAFNPAPLPRPPFPKSRMPIQPPPPRRPANRQIVKTVQRHRDPRAIPVQHVHPSRKLLPKRQRGSILQVRPPNFHYVRKFQRLGQQHVA